MRPTAVCSGSAQRRWPLLFDHGWQHTDFLPEPLPQDGTISHAIERVYPFVAQAAGYYPAVVMSRDYAVIRNDTMQAYATGMIRPLARVFDCTTFWGASSAAAGFAAKRHLFGIYGPLRQQPPPSRPQLAAG